MNELIEELEKTSQSLIKIIDQMKKMNTTYTKEDVRKLLADRAIAGFREEAKALVKKYGGGSLSKVDPSQYPDLVKEAEALGHE